MIVISGVLEDSGAWDVVSEDDLWDDETMAQREEDYVLVREEDIAEGIACFMATYLQSLKQTKVSKVQFPLYFVCCISAFRLSLYKLLSLCRT